MRVHVHRDEEREPTRYKVVVGEHNRDEWEGTEVTHDVELVYEHHKYNSYTNDNDLALLKLKEPIRFNLQVAPLCLEGTLRGGKPKCFVTGWGSTHSE